MRSKPIRRQSGAVAVSVCAAATLLAWTGRARGDGNTLVFNGAYGNDWADPSWTNLSGTGFDPEPGPGDTAVINGFAVTFEGQYSDITGDQPALVNLSAGSITQTFNSNPNIGGSTDSLMCASQMDVGVSGAGLYNLSSGECMLEGLLIGESPTGNGAFDIPTNPNVTLVVKTANGVVIGSDGGTGVLNQPDATTTLSAVQLGDGAANSVGTLNFSGGSMTVNNNVLVGNYYHATGYLLISGPQTALATVQINGSLVVGNYGNGYATISGGNVSAGALVLAANAPGSDASSGTMTLSGGTLTITGNETIGSAATGTFTQTGGTNSLAGYSLYVGVATTTVPSTYTLSGGQLSADTESVGAGGSGAFIQTGGTNTITTTLTISPTSVSANGSYTLSNTSSAATLVVGSQELIGTAGTATFQQSAGVNNNSGGTVVLGVNSNGNGTYNIGGGRLTTSQLEVGGLGTGLFDQTGGTVNVNGVMYLGYNSGSVGRYNMSAAGTLNATSLVIGTAAVGRFVESAGTVSVTGAVVVGANTGSSGTYNLSGSGSVTSVSESIGPSGTGHFLQYGGNNTTGSLTIGAAGFYTMTGGSMSLGGGAASGSLVGQNAGNLSVTAGTWFVANSVQFNNSGVATFGGTEVWGSGSILENDPGGVVTLSTDTGGVTLNLVGGTVTVTSSQRLGTTILNPASTLVFNAGTGSVVSIAGQILDSGTIDLQSGAIDGYTVKLAKVTNLVASGYNETGGGNWSGVGLTSSTAAADTRHVLAVGVIQNNQSGTPLYTATNLFNGTTPGTGDVLVRLTYFGDANLDGKVDGSDYSLIDSGYASRGTLTGWFNGDFNYDGVIDGSDYALIDNAFNNQGAALRPSTLVSPDTVQVGGATVPEPAGAVGGAIATAGLARRRRRRRVGRATLVGADEGSGVNLRERTRTRAGRKAVGGIWKT